MTKLMNLVFLLALSPIAGAAKAPELVTLKGADVPMWVSAASAVDETGAIRRDRFRPSTHARIERAVAKQRAALAYKSAALEVECPFTLTTHRGRQASSITDGLEHAGSIYAGRIVEIEVGFRDGVPESLLAVKVTQTFKGKLYSASETIYVFYPQARFSVGSAVFCNRGPRADYTPQVGDSIILMPAYVPLETEAPVATNQVVFYVSEEEMILGREARVILPRRFGNDRLATKSFDDLTAAIGVEWGER